MNKAHTVAPNHVGQLLIRLDSAFSAFGASDAARQALQLISDSLRILSDVNLPTSPEQAVNSFDTPLFRGLEKSLLASCDPSVSRRMTLKVCCFAGKKLAETTRRTSLSGSPTSQNRQEIKLSFADRLNAA